MTERGISKAQRAAQRSLDRGIRSAVRATRYSNPVGPAAIRSGKAAEKHMRKARQIILTLQMRMESGQSEKRKRLAAASSEFNKIAP